MEKYLTRNTNKIDVHASAHQLFDKIAQKDEALDDDVAKPGVFAGGDELMANEVLEDDVVVDEDELMSREVDDVAKPVDEETEAWITMNELEMEDDDDEIKEVDEDLKVMDDVAFLKQMDKLDRNKSVDTSSLSWYDDVYEKPSLVGAGLANLGNTCFFNAVMQCFTHSVVLVQGLYSFTHPTPCDCSNERFCLICAFREQVELSLFSSGKILSPWKFVNNLTYFSSSFQRYEQEDAHEFLQCFLDRLESSLTNLKAKDATFSAHTNNLVKQVFGGRVISKLRCCNCNHISDTYEPSVDLSLEIENANSLSTALESFTKVERIEDEEMSFTCDQCKEKVSVEKQLMLDQTPPVCAFHLKRFKNDGSHVEKIDKHVEFPLELDLQPYTCGTQSDNVDLAYELYAVVVHTAFTSSCGHYYSYIRSSPDTWYKFDDSKVTSVSEACVLSEEAYILFYAKQGTPWFLSFMETYKPSLGLNLSHTSPKSVLENVDHVSTSANHIFTSANHVSTSVDPPNGNLHGINESFSRATDIKVAVSETKDYPSQSDAVMPLRPINHVIKEKSPLTPKLYGSNQKVEVQKNVDVTPARRSTCQSPFDFDHVLSPSTPPRSPGLDDSDDENTEVVFAAKPEQLKLVEKISAKRQRNKTDEDLAKNEAVRRCRKMPGTRGDMLLAAMKSSESDNILNKKSKKMISATKKSYSRSSERFKYQDSPVTRNLATSSFR